MPTDKNHLIKIILAFAAVYIIWGTTYLAIRVAIETIPPFFMAGTRFLIAGILVYLFLRARGVPAPKRSHWPAAIIIGALLLGGGSGLVTWAELSIPSSVVALVIATVPIWITLFDWLIYKSGRPGKQIVAGLLLGLIGILLLIGPGQFIGPAPISWLTLAILLLSPILWSLGSLYSRNAHLPDNTFMATGMELLTGGIVLFLAGFLTGEPAQLDLGAISLRSWVALLYLFLFGSIIAFTAFVWLMKNVAASKVATYSYVNPVIAVFLGWLILSEPITPSMIAAVIVIVIAIILITTRQPRPSAPQEQAGANDGTPLPASQAAAAVTEAGQPALIPPAPPEKAVP